MAKPLPVKTQRILRQMIDAMLKGNIINGIVELVTNSDDSYRRLEADGKSVNGVIEIYLNRKKGGTCEKLKVKDYAGGMSQSELEKAIEFGGETSGFEEGKSVRGFFGRGLKETMLSLGEGQIKTINQGKSCSTKVWLENNKEFQYDDELLEIVEDTDKPDGTDVYINITNEKIKIPELDNFKEQLSKHLFLRDINSNKSRKVILTFDDLKRNAKSTVSITFSYPRGNRIKEVGITLRPFEDKVKLSIYESSELLDFLPNNPFGLAGILIKTKGAILDNQYNQSKYSRDPAAMYFFGEAICEGLETRLRNNETEIINLNRGGLEWRHEYCQVLSNAIDRELEPFILQKRKTLEKKPEKEVKEATNKMLRKLCSLLNELAKKELDDTESPPEPPPDIRDLTIIPAIANVQIEKPRVLLVMAPTEVVTKEGKEIHIKSDNVNIHPLASVKNLEKSFKYPETLLSTYFKVAGYKENAEGIITVKLGNKTATAKLKVAPPKEVGERKPRKGGFISGFDINEIDNPTQRVEYDNGIIRIFIKFPSVAKFIKSGLEGIEEPESKILMAELVGEAFCRTVARQKIEVEGYIPTGPTSAIDEFNYRVNELQKKHLHRIQEIILNWKF
ncbi:MAG: ATP-binding protein [Nanoarchaeota archaeon]|nr:ATP-binding protein [Nanoarchaeota archaeon]